MIGTRLSERYKLSSKLGSGGMSTVYLAVDEVLDREVAIKVLHREISDQPDQIERFRREARAVARLSHPNLVGVIDAGEDGGHPYIVFEYVPGETLKQRIDAGPLRTDEATAYAIEIGRGLASAHGARLVHRDVKPQNVLIDAEGRAKVTDFGIARSLEVHGLTATGRVLGTTDYVSPEQAMGKEVDSRTDVYSLGIVLYEMLTGEVPFQAETQVGVAMKHVNEPLPDVQQRRPEISASLAATVERATAKEPEDRYPDMSWFLAELEGALEVEVARAGGATTGEATSVLDSVPRSRRKILTRRRLSWVGVALLGAAAAAVAVALVVQNVGPTTEPPTTTTTDSAGTEIPLSATATDFDPVTSGGGGEEHSDETFMAVDGDKSSFWTSETYPAGLEGVPKDGVGLVVEAESPALPTEIDLITDGSGWTYEIYSSKEATIPPNLSDWGSPISGEATADSRSVAEPLDPTGKGRYFLIWVTSIPDEGSAQIGGVTLIG